MLFFQLLAPRLPFDHLQRLFVTDRTNISPAASDLVALDTQPSCPAHLPHIHTEHAAGSMALKENAERVAAEFDFGPDAVRKAVKEFIREMGTLQQL